MMMIRVVMIPCGVMPRMMWIVDGVMMREGMIVSMMATVRGRMVRVSVFRMAMMAVAAMSVRMMSSMPMPAMSALGQGRLTSSKHQSHDQRQSK